MIMTFKKAKLNLFLKENNLFLDLLILKNEKNSYRKKEY